VKRRTRAALSPGPGGFRLLLASGRRRFARRAPTPTGQMSSFVGSTSTFPLFYVVTRSARRLATAFHVVRAMPRARPAKLLFAFVHSRTSVSEVSDKLTPYLARVTSARRVPSAEEREHSRRDATGALASTVGYAPARACRDECDVDARSQDSADRRRTWLPSHLLGGRAAWMTGVRSRRRSGERSSSCNADCRTEPPHGSWWALPYC
jgi:hypothetical protein